MDEKYFEEANLIPKDELLEHVSLSVLRNTAIGLPSIADWKSGGVKKEPLEIFDINGKLLFLDYTIKKGAEILGTVRTCASKILGSPVIAHELGQRFWDHEAAIKKLIPKVKKEYPRQKILSSKLVCYSYPKLGVMFELADEQAKRSRLIFDVADLSPIPEKPPKPGYEGAYAWSFYDSLLEDARKLRLKRYDAFDKWRAEVPAKKLKELIAARTLLPYVEIIKWPFRLFATKLLQFCTHYNYHETRSHHCFVLHGQQKNDYCAVATAQMILCYYRYYYTQDQIAPALNYSSGWGCPPDQSAGYEQLSCNHLDATYDASPTWEKARDQIDALHPLKTGIPGHARACAGYSNTWWLFPIRQKSLYIYDPWPWKADYKQGGAVAWEDWDSLTHTNYVFTRILCPAD